jgi:hypothetical protein
MADLGLTNATGIGPGMAYELQWQMVRRIARWIEEERAKSRPNARQLETLYDRLSRILDRLMPYEMPKLAAVTVKGDTDSPLRVQADLSLLTDAELDTLEKICLKAGAGHTGGAHQEATSRQLPEPHRAAERLGRCITHGGRNASPDS